MRSSDGGIAPRDGLTGWEVTTTREGGITAGRMEFNLTRRGPYLPSKGMGWRGWALEGSEVQPVVAGCGGAQRAA